MTAMRAGAQRVPTYCYQCVAGPDLLTVKVVDGVATEVEPNFCAGEVHPGGGKVCVKAYGLVQKTYNPHRVLTPMRRTNPRKGRDEDPGLRADRLGRGARPSSPSALERRARRGTHRRIGLSARRRELRRRRHAAVVHGHASRRSSSAWGPVDMGFGSGQGVKCYHSEHLYGEFWHRAFTVSPDTPLTRLPDLLRRQCRGVRRRGRRVAPCQRARARHEARAGRAASFGHRCLLGAVGADQAQDRRGVPLRADACAAARDRARAARRRVSRPPYRVALSRRAERLLPARSRRPASRWCGNGAQRRRALRHARLDRGAGGRLRGRRRGDRRRTTTCLADGRLDGETAFARLVAHMAPYTPEWADGICDVPAATMRRIAQRISRSRARRRDDRDRRRDACLSSGGREPGQDRQQRLGRLRVRLGAHHARRAGRRARGARRHARHDRAAQSPAGASA